MTPKLHQVVRYLPFLRRPCVQMHKEPFDISSQRAKPSRMHNRLFGICGQRVPHILSWSTRYFVKISIQTGCEVHSPGWRSCLWPSSPLGTVFALETASCYIVSWSLPKLTRTAFRCRYIKGISAWWDTMCSWMRLWLWQNGDIWTFSASCNCNLDITGGNIPNKTVQ